MATSSDSDDDAFMAVDAEDGAAEGTMEQEEEPPAELELPEQPRHSRSMLELPEEVLEYILSFLSPYQEHKTAALVCKQWYRLIKGGGQGWFFGILGMGFGSCLCLSPCLRFPLCQLIPGKFQRSFSRLCSGQCRIEPSRVSKASLE
ncbi:F-box only protein 42-like protein [Willisornis vidua]|uniref:F-box only protein 42-like protein n=1 Tax=Willisornis vidua TaxID=1566151 RepID=A0ABQ9DU20_9PASS|nr:F-box only protein 42-like protein [Willisornis vidua]